MIELTISFLFIENPLACGCDMAWIFTYAPYYDAITELGMPTCYDGTELSEIDGGALIDFCLETIERFPINLKLVLKERK